LKTPVLISEITGLKLGLLDLFVRNLTFANFQAFTAVIFQVDVFWIVVEYQQWRGPCCIHLQCEM